MGEVQHKTKSSAFVRILQGQYHIRPNLARSLDTLLRPSSRALQRRVQHTRLVMTLMVKDDADIVRQNIEYHLAHGVCQIIACDHESSDGTTEILREFEAAGRLHLITRQGVVFEQPKWVNEMAGIARAKYAADYVFHSDADEFWVPASGDLRTEITRFRWTQCLRVPVYHSLLVDRGGTEHFPDDSHFFKTPPTDLRTNWRNRPEKCKVLFSTRAAIQQVDRGNHTLLDRKGIVPTYVSEDIRLLHFGIRNRDQFFKKVARSGQSLKPEIRTSVDIRRWYEAYKRGELDIYYKKNVNAEKRLRSLVEQGEVIRFDLSAIIPGVAPPSSAVQDPVQHQAQL